MTRRRRARASRSSTASTLAVAAGEIVGVAGVAGSGQNELVEAIIGLRAATTGRSSSAGRDVDERDIGQQRREAGLAYVPEDRHRVGHRPGLPATATTC